MRSSPPCLAALAACAATAIWAPPLAAWPIDGTGVADRGSVRLASRPPNDSQNRSVRIHNQTGWTMTGLDASSGGAWTGNLLGTGALAAGRSATVSIDDGTGACRYALRARFDNGETLQRDGINSCQIADYYFTR